jgi:hypothetical protein
MNYPLGSFVSSVPKLLLDFNPSPRSLNFVKAIGFTLPWETGKDKNGGLRADGGLHFRDGGVATKYGIWQGANPDIDVANLTLDQAIEIYKVRYWLVYATMKPVYSNLDQMEIGAAVSLFDAGVNCGPERAYGWFLTGNKTKDPAKIINDLRGAYYFNLVSLDRTKYGPDQKGWLLRLNDLKKFVDVLRLERDSTG